MNLRLRVATFVTAQGLAGTAGVVGVSGGPDSVALAHALLGQTGRLVLAHVNHGLRGADSAADERFVAELPSCWGADTTTRLSCRTVRLDTRTAAVGRNLEATARAQRYAWLAEVAAAEGARWVATAHTADDQAETVLFRLLRGSGLDGLRGLAERRPLAPGIELVRPLLALRRAEVRAYLAAHGLSFRDDKSNLDLAFTRNRLRHELIPQLERDYNPALTERLCRLAEQARAIQAEMHALAAALLAHAELPRAGATLVLQLDVLAAAPPQRLREALRMLWQREGWPLGAMGFDEWQRLVGLVHGAAVAWDLPGGVHVRRAERVLQLTGPCR